MKVKVQAIKLVCDCCGQVFYDGDDFCCYVDDEDGSSIAMCAEESGWIEIGDKDFCRDCYRIGDDDHYHIIDGRIYNEENGALITKQ